MSKKHHVIAYCLDNQNTVDELTSKLAMAGYQFETLGFADEYSGESLSKAIAKTKDKVILLVTDNFFKSAACMHEIFGAVQRLVNDSRLLPVVADGRHPQPGGGWVSEPTSFDRVSNVIQYMNHWQDQYLALRKEKRQHEEDPTLDKKIEMTRTISSEVGELLRFLRNQRCLTFEELKAKQYETFFRLNNDTFRFPQQDEPSAPESGEKATEKSLVELIEASGEDLMSENPGLDSSAKQEVAEEKQPESLNGSNGKSSEQPKHEARLEPPSSTLHVADSEVFFAESGQEAEEKKSKTKTSKSLGSMPPKEKSLDELSELIGAPKDNIDSVLSKFLSEDCVDEKHDHDEEPDVLGEVDIETLFDVVEDDDNDFHNTVQGLLDEEETVLLDLIEDSQEDEEEDENEQAPISPEEALENAICFFEEGKKEAGLSYLRAAVEEEPADDTLRYYFAYALARYGQNYPEATRQLDRLVNQTPGHADAWFLQAELAEIQGEFPSAKNHYEKVAAIRPDYPDVYYRLGLLTLLHLDNEHETAASFLKKAIEQNTKNADAHYQLATLYGERLGQLQEAIVHFRKALELHPEHPFANYDLALLFHKQGDRETAAEYYQKAILVNSELKTTQNDAAFSWEPAPLEVEPPAEPAATIGEKLETEQPEAAAPLKTEEKTKQQESELPAEPPEFSETGLFTDEIEDDLPETIEEIIEQAPANVAPDEPLNEVSVEPFATTVEEPAPFPIEELSVEEKTESQPLAPPMGMGKTVFISGATAGIGKATAEIFAKNGFRVIITGRREDRLETLKHDLGKLNGEQVLALPFDVRNLDSVKAVIDNLPEEWQNIDILVNNAGLARGFAPIHEGDVEHWDEMIDTNIKGLLYLTRLVSPQMVKRRSGHIINVASGAGKEVYPNGNVYCATKFAVDGLTKAMRLDLYKHNVRVSQVAPGHVEETEFARVRFDWDVDRAGQVYDNFQPLKASDVADAIYFIATRPEHVNIQDVLMFGSQQAGSNFIDRSGK
jgi:NADP-dependent 3-hydroxy acid dehydrogenase YdfG/tetratricopeptide (TPR) repeat protein